MKFTEPEEFVKTAEVVGQGTTLAGKVIGKGMLGMTIKDIGQLSKKWRWGLGAGAAGLIGLSTLGITGAMGGDVPGDTLGYRINRGMHGLLDRIRADEAVGESFAKTLGKGMGEAVVGLTHDMVSKGYTGLQDTFGLSPTRNKIFNMLKKEDPILADADNKTLMEAYHTMANIAPQLSTDKNAVKSVLRLAVTSGGGLDYNTIKGIADAETSLLKAKGGGNARSH